jgi:DNA modification methylase
MSSPTPTVEDRPLDQLTEWSRNPRRISKPRLEALKRALVAEPEMLQARPLIALPNGAVVAGNQRLRAARELGWLTLPTVTVDLDEARAAEWALRDNRGYGEDDEALVGALLAELAADGRALDLTGYDSGEVDRLLAAVRPAAVVDPDDPPPLPLEPRSVRGEVYELGPHRLMCGDATAEADVAALMASETAALVLTDPPYGVGIQERDLVQAGIRGRRKDGLGVTNDDLDGDALALLLRAAFTVALAATRPGAAWYVFGPAGVDYLHPLNVLADLGVARHGLVWVKDRFVMGRADYHYRHENVIYGWTPGASHRKLERRDLDSVLEYPRPGASPEHPTMKPVALVADLIEISSALGESVLDPFAGSGTTMIASQLLGRRCCAMEIDPAYCDVIRQRYADFTGKPELAP